MNAEEPTIGNVPGELLPSTKPASPTPGDERIRSVDVLRGVALMGILAVNIQMFSLTSYGLNPQYAGDFTGANFAAWLVMRVVFLSKMITIFSMLFGAGLILMDTRAQARKQSVLFVYYRRLLWLGLFGILHAYLLWEGDILFGYAFCGLILYPLRRLSAKMLIPLGLAGFLILPALTVPCGFLVDWAQTTAMEGKATGDQATEMQRLMVEVWDEVAVYLQPTDEALADEAEVVRGGYWGLFLKRAPTALGGQFGMVLVVSWSLVGLMLLGMALAKLEVFSTARSWTFYTALTLAGYGIGLPLVVFSTYDLVAHDFDLVRQLKFNEVLHEIGALPTALGHIGLVMIICKAGWLAPLMRCLAAAGRMALTNYLMQSLLCAVIFYGWGLGLFMRVPRVGLAGVVVAIWVFQLAISPIWLRFFRFGPVEWLWRSLTYWRRQPMRR